MGHQSGTHHARHHDLQEVIKTREWRVEVGQDNSSRAGGCGRKETRSLEHVCEGVLTLPERAETARYCDHKCSPTGLFLDCKSHLICIDLCCPVGPAIVAYELACAVDEVWENASVTFVGREIIDIIKLEMLTPRCYPRWGCVEANIGMPEGSRVLAVGIASRRVTEGLRGFVRE